ncbi:prenyltransferase/squalene oxidase repeat-containing protein [Kitasatospora sp. LaBMicrA B282]|uniref:prenyltransferase/squalene oxidase repeat-containing protein n=1 Tax=Kitasatospora sp. LaBMicrA B282 TaxID=3420949 RepID=UPI003D0AFF51
MTTDATEPTDATGPTATPAPTTAPAPARTAPARTVEEALALAADALRRHQHPDGHWQGDCRASLIGESGELVLRHYLRIPTDHTTAAAARTILAEQTPTGGWAAHPGGDDQLLVSVFCYVALRLAGHHPDEPELRAAAGAVRGLGGVEALDNPLMLAWLAMIGLWSWRDIPLLPPELLLLPDDAPGSIYHLGAAGRGVLVANSLLMARRSVVPTGFDIGELHARPTTGRPRRPLPLRAATTLSHWYARCALPPLRRRAIRKAARYLLRTQERDGGWGGNWPQTANALIGLDAAGLPADHPVRTRALAALDEYVTQHDGQRHVDLWIPVVMDTALALRATLAAPGADAKATETAVRWLLDNEVTEPGDWAVLTPDPAPGGWPFVFANNTNPDADDTGFVVAALRRAHPPGSDPAVDAACRRAVAWLVSQQCDDGGWAAFEPLRWRLPGRDRLAGIGLLEAPSADVTGHVLEALGADGQGDTPAARRAIAWLRDHQQPDGSWPGWWACHHLHGTSAAVTGLAACGVPGDDPALVRACAWIAAHQQEDGGWGEDIRALTDPSWIGRGTSTPSQTSWALLALIAAGRADTEPVRAGLEFLVRTQQDDGDWAEPQHTWIVYREGLTYRDSLLRLIYTVTALSAHRTATRGGR